MALTSSNIPSDAIQRVLFIASTVHVYNIPPLTSNKGYVAAQWTAENNKRQIFTARLRVIETAIPIPHGSGESLNTDVLLEDPSTGELFAKAPYADAKAVEAVIDSSRFFAVTVVGDDGRKATLGIGFEERSDAIDFGICLQECRKILGLEPQSKAKVTDRSEASKKDYGLKEGQTIKVDIGRRARRKEEKEPLRVSDTQDPAPSFSIKPPPGTSVPLLPPPPSAKEARAEKRRSRNVEASQSTTNALGFDDGEFGEFQ